MTARIEYSEGKLIDKIYTSYLVTWYTMFTIQGVDQITDKKSISISTRSGTYNFESMYNEYFSQHDTEEIIRNYAKITICSNFLKETFRLTQEYCVKNDLSSLLYLQPWYRFAKILVNCLSHDMIFNFNRVNPKHLPAEYNGISITKEMENHPLTDDFTANLFLDLGREIGQFVATEIEGANT